MVSSRLRPIPLSRMLMVPAAASTSIHIASSGSPASSAGVASARKRSLSLASEALEISSRRKISRWLYSEWIISCMSWRTSAWKPCVSRGVDIGFRPLFRKWYREPGVYGARGPPNQACAGVRGVISKDADQVAGGAQPVIHLVPEQQEYFQALCPSACGNMVEMRCACERVAPHRPAHRLRAATLAAPRGAAYARCSRHKAASPPRGYDHAADRRAQPQGRVRQDDDRHQSGQLLRAARRAAGDHGLRPAGLRGALGAQAPGQPGADLPDQRLREATTA